MTHPTFELPYHFIIFVFGTNQEQNDTMSLEQIRCAATAASFRRTLMLGDAVLRMKRVEWGEL